jgi:uncharacterized membrane protein
VGMTGLEAFSDGVLAIVITIMVLEPKVPHDPSFDGIAPLLPDFLGYVLSFIYVGIYWNNHHRMLHACSKVAGSILWANLHLLLWLSLFPFATGWTGENHFSTLPTALHGAVLLSAAMAYFMLQQTIIASQGQSSQLRLAVGKDGTSPASLGRPARGACNGEPQREADRDASRGSPHGCLRSGQHVLPRGCTKRAPCCSTPPAPTLGTCRTPHRRASSANRPESPPPPCAGRAFAAAIQATTRASRTSSGRLPAPSSSSWKARRSKAGPSSRVARSRSARILSCPTL